MSAPIRAKFASLAEIYQPVGLDIDINAADEIETLVLNAVMRK